MTLFRDILDQIEKTKERDRAIEEAVRSRIAAAEKAESRIVELGEEIAKLRAEMKEKEARHDV